MSKTLLTKFLPVARLTALSALLCTGSLHAQSLSDVSLAAAYGAQSHVIDFNDPTYPTLDENGNEVRKPFPFLADRKMLVKVNLVYSAGESSTQMRSSDVVVTLTLGLNGESHQFEMSPPGNEYLDSVFETDRVKVQHSFDNSYTTTVPKELMKPGLTWSVGWCHYDSASHCYVEEEGNLNVRPPIRMTVNAFPLEMFGWNWRSKSANINKYYEEMAERLPVSELIVEKPAKDYHQLRSVLVNAQRIGKDPIREPQIINNRFADGKLIWGTENRLGSAWNNALYEAAGTNFNQYAATHMLMGQKVSKGKGATNATTTSVLHRPAGYGLAWHESLHMYGLNHWGEFGKTGVGTYPYLGKYAGIAGSVDGKGNAIGHIGPSWGYDSRSNRFLSPTIMQQNGYPRWRTVPERFGNKDAHWSQGMKLSILSDWSAMRIIERWSSRPAWFDKDKDGYWVEKSGWHRYNSDQGKFVPVHPPENVKLHGLPDFSRPKVDVYTILMQASLATELRDEKWNFVRKIEPVALVHPPIGPYKTNLQVRINPTSEKSRNWGLRMGMCNEIKSFCDFSIRYKVNGKWRTYVLDRTFDYKPAATKALPGHSWPSNFINVAINLPVGDGEIEAAQMLLTPNVLQNPWQRNPKVLASWQR